MAFKFRLQRVLDYRRRQAEMAEMELAEARRYLADAEADLEQLHGRRIAALDDLVEHCRVAAQHDKSASLDRVSSRSCNLFDLPVTGLIGLVLKARDLSGAARRGLLLPFADGHTELDHLHVHSTVLVVGHIEDVGRFPGFGKLFGDGGTPK